MASLTALKEAFVGTKGSGVYPRRRVVSVSVLGLGLLFIGMIIGIPAPGNTGKQGSAQFIASVQSALGLIAERSPGARENGQLLNKLSKEARPRLVAGAPRDTADASDAPRGVRSRIIPSRRSTELVPGSAPGDLQIADILPELGDLASGPDTALLPIGLGSQLPGGGSFGGPGPVFIGGSGSPAPSGTIPPAPPMPQQPTPESAVPEPATWLMFIFGFAVIAGGMRRRAGKLTTKPSSRVGTPV